MRHANLEQGLVARRYREITQERAIERERERETETVRKRECVCV
jgi:hypothetical protein